MGTYLVVALAILVGFHVLKLHGVEGLCECDELSEFVDVAECFRRHLALEHQNERQEVGLDGDSAMAKTFPLLNLDVPEAYVCPHSRSWYKA